MPDVKTFFLVIFVFLGAALAGAATSAAESLPASLPAAAIPAEVQGLWAFPDCAGRNAALYTGRFVIEANGYLSQIARIDRVEENAADKTGGGTDAIRLHAGARQFSLLRGADGTMTRKLTEDLRPGMETPAMKDWSRFLQMTYKKCDHLTSGDEVLGDTGLRLFKRLDGLDAACAGSSLNESAGCREAVFDALDEDRSRTLSHAEIAQTYKDIAFLAASNSCPFKKYFPGDTDTAALPLAAALIGAADRDHDKALSLEEINNGWTVMAQQEKMKGLIKLAGSLAPIMPWLPDTGALPGCVRCLPPTP